MPKKPVTVYYDGLCHLCSREIHHYRGLKGSESVLFVDITSPQFDARSQGLDPKKVHQEIHVRRKDGSLAVGVDAFLAIWSELPRYHLAARVGARPIPRSILRAGYKAFAKVRPWLPRRKADCRASPYCDFSKP